MAFLKIYSTQTKPLLLLSAISLSTSCPSHLFKRVYIANMSELENSNGYLREDIQVDNITMDVNALQNC